MKWSLHRPCPSRLPDQELVYKTEEHDEDLTSMGRVSTCCEGGGALAGSVLESDREGLKAASPSYLG